MPDVNEIFYPLIPANSAEAKRRAAIQGRLLWMPVFADVAKQQDEGCGRE